MSKYADVLTILQIMGENHPLVEQTCLTLLIDEHTNSEAAAVELSFLLNRHQSDFSMDTFERNQQQISAATSPSQQTKQNTLPALSRSLPWHFSIPYLYEHQNKAAKEQPILEKLNQTQPHIYQQSNKLHRSAPLAQANNQQSLWYQLGAHLGRQRPNTQLDSEQLTRKFAQRQAIVNLPFKQPTKTDKETWLIIDQTASNYPFYEDFKQFTNQLYRYVGRNTVSKVIEITDFISPTYWRIRHPSLEISEHRTGLPPLPNNKQQLVLLCDLNNLQTARWQSWLKQATTLSSCLVKLTIKPQKGAIYFGHLKNQELANQNRKNNTGNINQITAEQLAKQNLLAILSITPARFTLAMIRELRQTLVGGSLALESQLFNHIEFNWLRASNNGYWRLPAGIHRETFKALPSTMQQRAIDIIHKHLPKSAPSLTHEVFLLVPTLLDETICKRYEEQIEAAVLFSQQIARKLKDNQNDLTNNQTYLNYIYEMACRMGDYADTIAPLAKQAITITNYQAKQLNPYLPTTAGIDKQLYLELKQKEHQIQPGKLLQQGDQLFTTSTNQCFGRQLTKLQDVSTLLFTQDSDAKHISVTPNIAFTPAQKTTKIQGESVLEKFTIALLNSNKLYWASSIDINEKGIFAKAENFECIWPIKPVTTQIEDANIDDILAQNLTVNINDNAPAWLKKYQPQLDQYGIYVVIPIESYELKLRYIPSGSFIMGSPTTEAGHKPNEKQHPVTLTQSFWLSETAVSNELWDLVMTSPVSKTDNIIELSHPVSNTNKNQTIRFFSQLFDNLGLVALPPSEAQWEYACRASTSTAYNNGKSTINTHGANFYSIEHVSDIKPSFYNVKMYNPNKWGLYQMHGNVWEMCLDSYQQDISEWHINPVSDTSFNSQNHSLTNFVARGGHVISNANDCRSAARKQFSFNAEANDIKRNPFYGLRICVANSDLLEQHENYIENALVTFKHKIQATNYETSNSMLPKSKHQDGSAITFIEVDNLDIAEHCTSKRWQLRPPPEFPNTWAKRYGCDEFGLWQILDLGDVNIRFRYVTSGHYITGTIQTDELTHLDEQPHQNTLHQGFWLAETTISVNQWNALIKRFNDIEPDNQNDLTEIPQSNNTPVTNLSWLQALKFCQLVNQLHPSLNIALPTEHQWEYACSGSKHLFNDIKQLQEYANFADWGNEPELIDVDHKRANAWGIKQMLGNVWEWCLDSYKSKINHHETDNIINDQQYSVLRGGSWLDKPENCRTAARFYAPKSTKTNNIGFRLCINTNESIDLNPYITTVAADLHTQQQKQPLLNKQIFGYVNCDEVIKADNQGQKELSVASENGENHSFDIEELISVISSPSSTKIKTTDEIQPSFTVDKIITSKLRKQTSKAELPHFESGDSLGLQYKFRWSLQQKILLIASAFFHSVEHQSKRIERGVVSETYTVLVDNTHPDTIALVEVNDTTITFKVKGSNKSAYIKTLGETMNKIIDGFRKRNFDSPYAVSVSHFKTMDSASSFNYQNCNFELQGALNDLASELISANNQMQAKQLEEARIALEKAENFQTPSEVKKSGVTPRIKRLFKEMGDKNSSLHKVIKGTKNGVSIAQDMAEKYNSIAEWAGLPLIPQVFLKKDK